jgi:hypothetical protein
MLNLRSVIAKTKQYYYRRDYVNMNIKISELTKIQQGSNNATNID